MVKQILMFISIILAIAVALFIGNSYIRNQAVNDCMNASKIETVIKQGDQIQTVNQPNGGWYGTCLKDKGIK